jgi:antitoxin component YwqK of YwqJK toxin-antitoxin module
MGNCNKTPGDPSNGRRTIEMTRNLFLMSVLIITLGCIAGEGAKTTHDKGKGITVNAIKNPDNTITSFFYSEGKEIAQQVRDRDGTIIKAIGTVPDGIVREYFESGKLKEVSSYKNNKREGTSKWYYENGVLRAERPYKDDKLNGIVKWHYTTGSLGTEFNYTDGKLEGLTRLYWENGNLKAEDYYKDGKREGRKTLYYKSGQLRFVYTYKNGKKINRKAYSKGGVLMSDENY